MNRPADSLWGGICSVKDLKTAKSTGLRGLSGRESRATGSPRFVITTVSPEATKAASSLRRAFASARLTYSLSISSPDLTNKVVTL